MKVKKILFPIILVELYIFFDFCINKLLYDKNLLISIKDINSSNFLIWLFYNILLSSLILIAIGIALLRKVNVIEYLKLTMDKHKIVYALFVLYVVMFFIIHDFSIAGCCRWIYYLVFIAIEEEIVFRGYLFTALEKEMPMIVAIIISGIIWGSAHAYMPILLHTPLEMEPMRLILIEGISGIGAGAMFILLYKKSNTLLVPILVHAILDFII